MSEFMLQQTPVARVIPHLEAWLERWPTPTMQADASPAETVTQWANLGYPRRALWLHRAAVEIRDRHGGIVPREVEALLELTGIGDYTARAVAVFAYGEHHPVVDTNTRRVLARAIHGRSQPGPPSKRDLSDMEEFLHGNEEESPALNAAAMELGAIVCTARAPRCDACPIRTACAWFIAGRPDTGDERRRQARYEGSDRQARGVVLRALRDATPGPVAASDITHAWADAGQRDRAIDSLIADGLIEADGEQLVLPHA